MHHPLIMASLQFVLPGNQRCLRHKREKQSVCASRAVGALPALGVDGQGQPLSKLPQRSGSGRAETLWAGDKWDMACTGTCTHVFTFIGSALQL